LKDVTQMISTKNLTSPMKAITPDMVMSNIEFFLNKKGYFTAKNKYTV